MRRKTRFTLNEEPSPYNLCLIIGLGGSGKTSFATRGAPSPMVLMNYDGRSSHAVRMSRKPPFNKQIYFVEIPYIGEKEIEDKRLEPYQVREVGKEALLDHRLHFYEAVDRAKKGEIKTIVVDTVTELEYLMRYAFRGELNPNGQDHGRSRGLMNAEIWSMAKACRNVCHLIFLARAREIWIDSKSGRGQSPSGKYEPVCGPTVIDSVDWSGYISINEKTRHNRFEIKVQKAGVTKSEKSQVYTEDDWGNDGAFKFCCMMQYPELDEDSWA